MIGRGRVHFYSAWNHKKTYCFRLKLRSEYIRLINHELYQISEAKIGDDPLVRKLNQNKTLHKQIQGLISNIVAASNINKKSTFNKKRHIKLYNILLLIFHERAQHPKSKRTFLSRLRSEKKCSENTIPPTQPEFTSSKSTKKTPEQCMIDVQSFKWRHQNKVNCVVLVSFKLP